MWRRALNAAVTEARHRTTSVTTTTFRRNYAAKPPKPKPTTAAKSQKKKWSSNKGGGSSKINPQSATTEVVAELEGDQLRKKLLAEDAMKNSLDVGGPNGGPLFTPVSNISELTSDDACSYIRFDMEKLNGVLPEGLPVGMVKEFEDSMCCALLVRRSFLYLRDNFRRLVDPVTLGSKAPKAKKQIVLDGPRSCGKSIALAMLAHWARDEGWLVFYAPKGRDWTHGGYFYKNEETGFWDTPLQAENILKDFLKFNESRLQQLPCQVYDSIPLGEGVGVGFMEGADSITMPEGSTLFDLVQTGVTNNHAAVGVVVHLRKELSLVKDVPVLIAIDQYNSWFTFSEYNEILSHHSSRPVHARELATINAFRPMKHGVMMVGAFSHSNAVGKLRQDLPGVPDGARVNFPRYSLDEAAAVCHYYLRQRLIRREVFTDEKWKKMYYLSNGNGSEMRKLSPLMW